MSKLEKNRTQIPKRGAEARRPPWLRVKVTPTDEYDEVNALLQDLTLTTVCTEARCPNIWECWGKHRTATFMIFGDTCSRNCRYCSVKSGAPPALDPEEPERVAEAVAKLNLRHAVITSVTRDDLSDGGAAHFAATVEAIRAHHRCRIEVLIPDFGGDADALRLVLAAKPDVLGHNLETVPRLFSTLRPQGDYKRSLQLLERARGEVTITKSGLMVGLGESRSEIRGVMEDLRAVGCDVLTLGQYLNPTVHHAPVARFYPPEEFDELGNEARALGFRHCESGPLVRSSYHAHAHMPSK